MSKKEVDPNILPKKQAIELLGLDAKTFDNYFKNAKEFHPLPRKNGRGRFYFDKRQLSEWKKGFQWRTVNLTKDEYALCLDFALAQHFKKYVTSDFGTGRQREFGQKITNWVKGQLGEIAVQRFLKKEFGVLVKLDFDIHDVIVQQDIIGITKNRKVRKPKIGVGIKSSKPKSAFLVLGDNEMRIQGRQSDIYIFCRPDIPDDHLLRLAKRVVASTVQHKPHYSRYKNLIPGFADIPCEIAGWCTRRELRKTKTIPGQNFDGFRHVRESGLLKKSKKDWQELINRL